MSLSPEEFQRYEPEWGAMVRQSLKGVIQDPVYHAEGDVLTHTEMVLAQLRTNPGFEILGEETRHVLYAAALLHDIGKINCCQVEEGRVKNRGHSLQGSIIARGLLYGFGVERRRRESICLLIELHMHPARTHKTDSTLISKYIQQANTMVGEALLVMLALSDIKGRVNKSDDGSALKSLTDFYKMCISRYNPKNQFPETVPYIDKNKPVFRYYCGIPGPPEGISGCYKMEDYRADSIYGKLHRHESINARGPTTKKDLEQSVSRAKTFGYRTVIVYNEHPYADIVASTNDSSALDAAINSWYFPNKWCADEVVNGL